MFNFRSMMQEGLGGGLPWGGGGSFLGGGLSATGLGGNNQFGSQFGNPFGAGYQGIWDLFSQPTGFLNLFQGLLGRDNEAQQPAPAPAPAPTMPAQAQMPQLPQTQMRAHAPIPQQQRPVHSFSNIGRVPWLGGFPGQGQGVSGGFPGQGSLPSPMRSLVSED